MVRRVRWLIGAALVVLSACSGGGSDDASVPSEPSPATASPTTVMTEATAPDSSAATPPTTEPEPEPEPEIDAALMTIGDLHDEEGVLPVEAALQLFATLVTPLDGVEPLALDGDVPPDAAAMAIRRMDGARDELAPDQVAALDEALALPDGVEEVEIATGVSRARIIDLSDVPTDPPDAATLEAMIDGVVGVFESDTGHMLGLPIRASVVPRSRTGGDARTSPSGGTPSSPASCRILFPDSLFGPDQSSTMSTVAHEVWHCFQLDANPAAFSSGPNWIIEGQAEFAGESYVSGSASSSSEWNTWLLSPAQRLTGRSYDAIGLYAVAEQSASDPFGTMLPMLGRSGTSAVETLFGGTGATIAIRQIATALARVPEMGAEWESTGPGITDANAADVLAVGADETQHARGTLGRLATLPVVLAVSDGEILRVNFIGGTAAAVAMPGAGTISAAPGDTVNLCLRPEDCVCPDGSDPYGAGSLPHAQYGEGAAAIGAVDGGDASITVTTVSVDEACTDSLVGVWVTTVRQAFQILSAPYGGAPPTCEGPFTVTFTADGRWSTVFQAECLVVDTVATANAELSGSYTATEDTFTVADIAGAGQMTIFGQTQPIPIVDGYAAAMGRPVQYSINAGVLSYTFTAPDGNTFTFNLTRAE